jgi:hypothetical protein
MAHTTYTRRFKPQALRMMAGSGRAVAEVARQLKSRILERPVKHSYKGGAMLPKRFLGAD